MLSRFSTHSRRKFTFCLECTHYCVTTFCISEIKSRYFRSPVKPLAYDICNRTFRTFSFRFQHDGKSKTPRVRLCRPATTKCVLCVGSTLITFERAIVSTVFPAHGNTVIYHDLCVSIITYVRIHYVYVYSTHVLFAHSVCRFSAVSRRGPINITNPSAVQ